MYPQLAHWAAHKGPCRGGGFARYASTLEERVRAQAELLTREGTAAALIAHLGETLELA
eukprot:SAG11_NODE_14024_length_628_cov_1.058601_1_plen_58_part_10